MGDHSPAFSASELAASVKLRRRCKGSFTIIQGFDDLIDQIG